MFKMIFSFIILSLSTFTWAGSPPCKVFGISDSPQSLRCVFEHKNVNLTCFDGRYHLNKLKVSQAYHMDVEAGATPLVFEAHSMTLTVVMGNPITAELIQSKISVMGLCK